MDNKWRYAGRFGRKECYIICDKRPHNLYYTRDNGIVEGGTDITHLQGDQYDFTHEEAEEIVKMLNDTNADSVFGNKKCIEIRVPEQLWKAAVKRANELGHITPDYLYDSNGGQRKYLILYKIGGDAGFNERQWDEAAVGSLDILFNSDKYAVISHPKIKIGCQTVNFEDYGEYIIVQEEKIQFDTVEKIYEHMVKLRKTDNE